MKKKVLIIEDNLQHYKLIKQGIELSQTKFEICEVNLDKLIYAIKADIAISLVPQSIDLFIIDVSLEKGQDELGLRFLLELKSKYKTDYKYIIASNWDKSEFETKIAIDDNIFVNKNNHQGFELKLKIRNTINNLLL